MLSHLKRWYSGEVREREYENDPHSRLVFMPSSYTEYHWTAKVARAVVSYYLSHWQWLWAMAVGLVGLYLSV